MDWNAIQQYLPLYQKAAVLTVRLGVAGIIFAIIIGLACAVIQYDKVPVLRQIVGVYIQLSRNTPLLVQLFAHGECVYRSPSLPEIRAHCAAQLDTLWDEVKRFENPHHYYVDLSQPLWDLKERLLKEHSEA